MAEPTLWQIAGPIALGGAIGGSVDFSGRFELSKCPDQSVRIMYLNLPVTKTQFSLLCAKSAAIGFGGAIAFAIPLLRTQTDLAQTASALNAVLLFAWSLTAGFVARVLLPQLASRLIEEKVTEHSRVIAAQGKELEETKVTLDEEREETTILRAYVDLDHEPTKKDLERHAANLSPIVDRNPKARQATIILARVYRKLEDLNRAIEVVTRFVNSKEGAGEVTDKDFADALYNRGIYYLERAGSPTIDTKERDRLRDCAADDLRRSFRIRPQNVAFAKEDTKDFPLIQGLGVTFLQQAGLS